MTAQLFGDFELKSSTGEQLELKARKTLALLAVLILEDARWLSRDGLAGLLWGDRPDARARSSLSQALYEIRKLEAALGVTIVEREAERLRLAEDSVESDIRAFRTALMANIPEAANYRPHELLDGIDLRDQAFADWLLSKRTEYHEKLSDALRGLA